MPSLVCWQGTEGGLQAVPVSEFLPMPDVWKVVCGLFAMDTKLGGLSWPAERTRVKPVAVEMGK